MEESKVGPFTVHAKVEDFKDDMDLYDLVEEGLTMASEYYVKIIENADDIQLDEMLNKLVEDKKIIENTKVPYDSKDSFAEIIKPIIQFFYEIQLYDDIFKKLSIEIADWIITEIKKILDKKGLLFNGNILDVDVEIPELIKPLKPAVTAESKKKKQEISKEKGIEAQKSKDKGRGI